MTPFLITLGAIIIAAIVCRCICNAHVNALYDRLRRERNLIADLEQAVEAADVPPTMVYDVEHDAFLVVRDHYNGVRVIIAEFTGDGDGFSLANELVEILEQFRYYNK